MLTELQHKFNSKQDDFWTFDELCKDLRINLAQIEDLQESIRLHYIDPMVGKIVWGAYLFCTDEWDNDFEYLLVKGQVVSGSFKLVISEKSIGLTLNYEVSREEVDNKPVKVQHKPIRMSSRAVFDNKKEAEALVKELNKMFLP